MIKMKIHKISYIENGYFEVKYNIGTVVQDLEGIKMTCPLDKSIKVIIMFLRRIKIEKLQDGDNFDDLKYRDYIIKDDTKEIEAANKAHIDSMKRAASMFPPTIYEVSR